MKRKRNVYWTLILCIIIAAVVFPFSVNKMQDTLLKSGQSMGAESASKYGSREEMYTEQYEYILNLLEYQLRPGHAISDLEQFMKNFLEMADETMDLKGIELYGYIDGKIVAATPWEGDASYDAASTEWYQGGVADRWCLLYKCVRGCASGRGSSYHVQADRRNGQCSGSGYLSE